MVACSLIVALNLWDSFTAAYFALAIPAPVIAAALLSVMLLGIPSRCHLVDLLGSCGVDSTQCESSPWQPPPNAST
jgi:hypothetical protein